MQPATPYATPSSSHRQILKSSAIIGGSTIIAIAIGILRVKVLAVLLGAMGVGLMGIFQNIMNVAATIAGCGLGTSGVRQLAASEGNPHILDAVRHTLWYSNMLLGIVGGLTLWLLRFQVAYWVFKNDAYATEVGLLGVGVWCTLLAASQMVLLQGLRQIGALARLKIFAALFGALFGVAFAWWLGINGIIWFVIIAPLTATITGAWYAAQLPRPQTKLSFQQAKTQFILMFRLGVPFMFTSLITLGTQFLSRVLIIRELGLQAAGHFQAGWDISIYYMGFVLGAMATDYYPRLSAVIHDPPAARQLVVDQTEMAFLLGAPALLLIIATAPWVIYLLYASDFSPAIEVLRWQSVGNFLKVVSWPMGFILLAQAKGGWFIFTETIANITYLLFLFVGIPYWGLDTAGYAFIVMYFVYFCTQIIVTRQLLQYQFPSNILLLLVLVTLVGTGIIILAHIHLFFSFLIGIPVSVLFGMYCLYRIDSHVHLRTWLHNRWQKKRTDTNRSPTSNSSDLHIS